MHQPSWLPNDQATRPWIGKINNWHYNCRSLRIAPILLVFLVASFEFYFVQINWFSSLLSKNKIVGVSLGEARRAEATRGKDEEVLLSVKLTSCQLSQVSLSYQFKWWNCGLRSFIIELRIIRPIFHSKIFGIETHNDEAEPSKVCYENRSFFFPNLSYLQIFCAVWDALIFIKFFTCSSSSKCSINEVPKYF